MAGARIVLANSSLAGYPEAGGLWTLYLQYFLGLLHLGHDVYWLELLRRPVDEERTRDCLAIFFARMGEFGLDDRCCLLLHEANAGHPTLETARAFGRIADGIRDIASTADFLWNLCGALRQPLLSLFRHRVFVDLDPGHLQVSALSWDLGLSDHHTFLSVGSKLNDPDCEVPRLGLAWHTFVPFVYLPMWQARADPHPGAPVTTVTQWNWSEIWLAERALSISKREAYLRYLELPRYATRPFELAANIHPSDATGDRELLQHHGWRLVDPNQVAGSPRDYQQYIARSQAELCCPKPIFRLLRTGWFSDRSVCYLASGRPVLAEDTGFGDHLPTGHGLLTFRGMAEAAAGVEELDRNYAHHSRAARELAAELFDSTHRLTAMLSACGA